MVESDIPLPALTAAQMARVDRVLIDELGLDVLQPMEVAGRAVAAFARDRFLDGDPRDRRVVVLAGGGGNGGDGLVAARFLLGWGARVEVWLGLEPATLRGPAARQHGALVELGVPLVPPSGTPRLSVADLMIDALLGFGLAGPPSGATADLVRAANAAAAPVLAVDLPSGLDATDGTVFDPCIRAAATLTLALPKTGLLTPAARTVVGALYAADIGVPAAVYARLGVAAGPLFARRDIVRLA